MKSSRSHSPSPPPPPPPPLSPPSHNSLQSTEFPSPSSSSSSISQLLILYNHPLTLITIFPTINSFSNKNYLIQSLTLIRSHEHLYYSQWIEFSKHHSNLFDLTFELLKQYEINGLQLHGLGCWFFYQIFHLSNLNLLHSSKYSKEIIIELLLRILLEHSSVATLCIAIFTEIIKNNPECVQIICQIGKFLCSNSSSYF